MCTCWEHVAVHWCVSKQIAVIVVQVLVWTVGSAWLHHTVPGRMDHPRLLRSHWVTHCLLASVEGRVTERSREIPLEFPSSEVVQVLVWTVGSTCLHHTVPGLMDHPRLLRSHWVTHCLLASVEGRVMERSREIPLELPSSKLQGVHMFPYTVK